jgi:hypothetical protein
MIGAMQMPAGFKYKEILRRGRPSHENLTTFWTAHLNASSHHSAQNTLFSFLAAAAGQSSPVSQ